MRARLDTARTVLVPYVVSRVVVVGALLTIRHVISVQHFAEPVQTRDGLLAWDGAWYRDIARHGYDVVHAREGLRFFPLFPLLARLVAVAPGVSAGAGVVIVANVFAFVLGMVVYQLAMHERADAALARRAVWLLYLVPPAYVLVLGYAEALFMTAAALVLLTLRQRRWWIAAVAGFAAGLTRPVGALLAVPAAIEGVQQRDARALAPAAAPVAGMLAYLLYANSKAHDFLAPLRLQQDAVRRGAWVDPFRAVAHNVHELFSGDHVSAGIHVISALVFAGLLIQLARRWPLSFTVYAAVSLFVALSSKNLDSLERYGLATVPFVLAGADLLRSDERERVVLTLAAAGLIAAAILAFTGVLVP